MKEKVLTMTLDYILTGVSILCTLIAVFISYYIYYKKKIETEAIDAINRAEDTDLKRQEKLQHAVKDVSSMIPAVLKPFINDAVIETIIQTVFDKIEEYCAKQTPDNEDSKESSTDEVTTK